MYRFKGRLDGSSVEGDSCELIPLHSCMGFLHLDRYQQGVLGRQIGLGKTSRHQYCSE